MATMTPDELRTTSDLASMEGLNEDRLNDALSRRYASDVIYVSRQQDRDTVCVCVWFREEKERKREEKRRLV
jgi:hypothetical protein